MSASVWIRADSLVNLLTTKSGSSLNEQHCEKSMTPFSSHSALRAILSSLIAAVLFSLRQAIPLGSWSAALIAGLFAVPTAVVITVVFLLPLLAIMKRYRRSHPLEYMLYPAVVVLFICMLSLLLSPGLYSTLNVDGKKFISQSHLVWSNFGWMIIFNLEPAIWAAFAGFCSGKLTATPSRRCKAVDDRFGGGPDTS